MQQQLDIVFIGNNTFSGFTICEYFHAAGKRVIHLYVPRQTKRCSANEYYENTIPEWSRELRTFDEIHTAIRRLYADSLIGSATKVFACGDQEVFHLCKWKIRHRWIADGSDLTEIPFEMTKASLDLRLTIQGSQYIEKVFGTQRDMKHSARLLGLSDRFSEVSLPPPIRLINKCKELQLLLQKELEQNYSYGDEGSRSSTLILSASRRVYSDNKFTFSKGTELLAPAFKRLQDVSGSDHLGTYQILATLSGPESQRFVNDLNRHNIINVGFLKHMSQAKLHNIFLRRRVVSIDQFGERETALSGILRESLSLGVPCVSDQNLRDMVSDEKDLFFRAINSDEIAVHLTSLISLSDRAYFHLRLGIITRASELMNTTLIARSYCR